MTKQIVGLVIFLYGLGWCDYALAETAREETLIRALVMRQEETWNRHDAKAYAALFAKNADVVNVVGWWWQGREELQRKMTAAYAAMFKDSRLRIGDMQVRFLTPEIAVAHVR